MRCEAERVRVVLRVAVREPLLVRDGVTLALALSLPDALSLALTLAVSLSLTVCDHVPDRCCESEGDSVDDGDRADVRELLAAPLAVALAVGETEALDAAEAVPLCDAVAAPVLLRDPVRVAAPLRDTLCVRDAIVLGVAVSDAVDPCVDVFEPDAVELRVAEVVAEVVAEGLVVAAALRVPELVGEAAAVRVSVPDTDGPWLRVLSWLPDAVPLALRP